jgi:hypothetical protein
MPWRRWRIEINAMQNLRLTTPPPLIYYHLLPLSHTHTHRERERLDCFLFNDRERGQLSKMLHLCLCREFVYYLMSDRYFICSNMQRWKHTRYANIQKVFWLNTSSVFKGILSTSCVIFSYPKLLSNFYRNLPQYPCCSIRATGIKIDK